MIVHAMYLRCGGSRRFSIFHFTKAISTSNNIDRKNRKMAQSASLLSRIVASSITATVRAGKIIRDVMSHGGLNIVEKGKNDLQTEADRCAQRCIIASLSCQFPNITIIGEEESSDCDVPSDWVVTEADQEVLKLKLPEHLEDIDPKDVCVWVDPLDGEYTFILFECISHSKTQAFNSSNMLERSNAFRNIRIYTGSCRACYSFSRSGDWTKGGWRCNSPTVLQEHRERYIGTYSMGY